VPHEGPDKTSKDDSHRLATIHNLANVWRLRRVTQIPKTISTGESDPHSSSW